VKSCNFIEYTVGTAGEYYFTSFKRYGLFRFENEFLQCQSYASNLEFDSNSEAARVFGALATLIGGIVLLAIIYQLYWGMSQVGGQLWKASVGSLLLVCMGFQILTFLVFDSNGCKGHDECKVGSGASASISAAVLYLLTGVAVFGTIPPRGALLKWDASCMLTEEALGTSETGNSNNLGQEAGGESGAAEEV